MDARLDPLWKTGKPPFGGQCIRVTDHVPLPILRSVLGAIVETLPQHIEDTSLFRFDDWHEHDGFVTEARPTDWAALKEVLANDQNLHRPRPKNPASNRIVA